MKKLYIVRKFVVAESVSDALRKEKKITADEVWLHDASVGELIPVKKQPIGFNKKK